MGINTKAFLITLGIFAHIVMLGILFAKYPDFMVTAFAVIALVFILSVSFYAVFLLIKENLKHKGSDSDSDYIPM